MNVYRLRIDEIKGGAMITSYTRWLESVEVRGTENQEVFRNIQSTLRAYLAGIEETAEDVAKEPANIRLRSAYSIRPVLLGQEARLGRKEAHLIGRPAKSAWVGISKPCKCHIFHI
jgi:hypothetical protein